MKEYLSTLTKRGQWFSKVEPLKVGDIVAVCDDKLPRNLWPKDSITFTLDLTDKSELAT